MSDNFNVSELDYFVACDQARLSYRNISHITLKKVFISTLFYTSTESQVHNAHNNPSIHLMLTCALLIDNFQEKLRISSNFAHLNTY